MSVSTAIPQKFSFGLDMASGNEKTRSIGDSELASMIKAAEDRAFQKGVIEGENSAANRAAAELVKGANLIAQSTIDIIRTTDQNQKQTLIDATNLGVATGRKLAGNLIARFPLGEIRSLIGECLSSLESVPHLVIRCHPNLATAIEAEAQKQMKTSGFTGRLVIIGEPEILAGDARLEWVDGGLVRDLGKISSEIDERIQSFVAATNFGGANPASTSSNTNVPNTNVPNTGVPNTGLPENSKITENNQ